MVQVNGRLRKRASQRRTREQVLTTGRRSSTGGTAHHSIRRRMSRRTPISHSENHMEAVAQVAAASVTPDYAAIKSRQQVTWASGDFGIIGTTLQIVGESLCESVDLRAGSRVLDVAAGNGNATLAAARRFGEVISTDYVPAPLGGGSPPPLRPGLAGGGPRARRGRRPWGAVPGSGRREPAVSGPVVRRRALDLRRDVHARSAEGRRRAGPRVQAGRPHRTGQLDAGRLRRPAVQAGRQVRSAA